MLMCGPGEEDSHINIDVDGWTVAPVFDQEQESLRIVKINKVDVTIAFSTATRREVYDHFHLTEGRTVPMEQKEVPPQLELTSVIDKVVRNNTMEREPARRTIISLYLTYALDYLAGRFASEEARLLINEEMIASCVYTVNNRNILYRGPIDFAIGYTIPTYSSMRIALSLS
ncbi:hypothetical protein HKX48_004080 [Thoreauomyces humboldtii]|nr:hypothetical protein HKX48_004080 [Thoreauomyces humboldtii]